ncbi:hypothetical protein ACFYR1_51605 [Streptomyces canus]|uniref:hypothetical protein n=1 Tax=Streptomyces canus TaxID=58343 RepID=UPI003681D5E8
METAKGSGGRGRGRPTTLRAETEEDAALARWLEKLTAGMTIRQLSERFPYNKTKWAEFRNGTKRIPDWLLKQLVSELIREPRMREKKLAEGLRLLEHAEQAAAGKLPAAVRQLPEQELLVRLDEARQGQIDAQKTLLGTMQLVMMLLNVVHNLTTQYEAMQQQYQALEDQNAAHRRRLYETRLQLAEQHLAEARNARSEAEDVHLAAYSQSELYRRLLGPSHRQTAPLLPQGEARHTDLSDLTMEQCDQLLSDSETYLAQARLALDDLRIRLGLAPTEQRVVRGQLADNSADEPTVADAPAALPHPGSGERADVLVRRWPYAFLAPVLVAYWLLAMFHGAGIRAVHSTSPTLLAYGYLMNDAVWVVDFLMWSSLAVGVFRIIHAVAWGRFGDWKWGWRLPLRLLLVGFVLFLAVLVFPSLSSFWPLDVLIDDTIRGWGLQPST